MLSLFGYSEVREGDRSSLVPLFHLPWFVMFMAMREGRLYVLTPSVLTLVPTRMSRTYIPLANAEIKPHKHGWRIRWRAAHWMAEILPVPPAFAEALERAMAASVAAPPGAVPRTMRDARRAVTVEPPAFERWLMGAWALVVAIVSGLIIWQIQPLYALLLIPPLIWLHWWQRSTVYVVEGKHLWVLTPGQEPQGARLAEVQSLTSIHRWDVIVLTSNPDMPQVRIAASGEMAKRLRRHLLGEVEPPFSDAPKAIDAPVPPVEPLRCTLCGQPAPNIRAAASTSGIHICDHCSARSRQEAAESGHGIAGKDRLPL